MHNQKLFGTDGVRGTANIDPVTAEIALRLGRAAAHVVAQLPGYSRNGSRRRIVIGKDTRLSGYLLESALTSGVLSMGVDVLLIGPLPTPGVAYITRALRADAGIALTASHNPYQDNGIKFFRHDGYKLDDEAEARIEALVFNGETDHIRPTAGELGRAKRIDDALGRYVEFAKQSFPRSRTLEGLKIALDCANGAAYKASPLILRELGAEVFVVHNTPDGTNINENCGSMHPGEIQKLVRQTGAHVGISHDGDADRVLLADETGEIVDGDEILAIAALDFLRRGQLAENTLVATIMSNCGLDELLEQHGGRVLRTKVGDRYVIEEMQARGLNVGGEQSGHLIFRDYSTTGDGIVAALQILRIMVESGRPLSELRRCLHKYPQAQRNLRVREKPPLETLEEAGALVRSTELALAGKGRVLLRYSGTEPKIRLLLEGRDAAYLEERADAIASAILRQIGEQSS
jgi:phosphoglucosamine mutase